MRKFFLAAVALISLCLTAFSQSITPTVINSSGGTAKVNNKFYLDWSVGEMTLVNTMQNTGYSGLIIVTNGFLQPDKDDAEGDETVPDYVKNSLKPDIKAISLRVYPNPASNYVMIEFPDEETGKIRLTLYDAMGKLVYEKELTTYGHHTMERISMAAFMQGTYLLRVQIGALGLKSKEITYKIFKAN